MKKNHTTLSHSFSFSGSMRGKYFSLCAAGILFRKGYLVCCAMGAMGSRYGQLPVFQKSVCKIFRGCMPLCPTDHGGQSVLGSAESGDADLQDGHGT